MKKSDKGQVIRVSREVYEALARRKSGFRSWDSMLRCLLGMKPRRGSFKPLREGYVLRNKFFAKGSEARGAAVKLAVTSGSEKIESPMRVRETL